MKFLFIIASIILITQSSFAQTHTFRYSENGFSDYGDVQITSSDTDKSGGASGQIDYNVVSLLVRFGGIEVPAGIYSINLKFVVSNIYDPGTITVYQINDANWEDPAMTLNPPSSVSNYPTWSHANYNSRAWSVSGLIGGSEIETTLGTAYVNTPSTYNVGGATASIESATDFAFLMTMSNDAILYVKESAANYTQMPMLTLTALELFNPPRPLGGLDWNGVFQPYPSLR